MNGYDLTRYWYNYKFENPDKVKAIHSDMYFYIVDLWNRLGQKEKFGLPTMITMENLSIGSRNTYYKVINDLCDFGFIKMVSESKNQHQSRIIAISKNEQASNQALEQAHIQASNQAREQALEQTTEHIDKQLNKEQLNKLTINNTLLSEIEISDLEDNVLEYFQIAKAFQQLFIKNLKEKNSPSKIQEQAKFKNYVDPIRLMMENDGVTKEQLTKVFKYLGSNEGEFWKPNILSTKKLREKFSQLSIKSQENGNRNNNIPKSDAELKRSASDAVDRMFGRK